MRGDGAITFENVRKGGIVSIEWKNFFVPKSLPKRTSGESSHPVENTTRFLHPWISESLP